MITTQSGMLMVLSESETHINHEKHDKQPSYKLAKLILP